MVQFHTNIRFGGGIKLWNFTRHFRHGCRCRDQVYETSDQILIYKMPKRFFFQRIIYFEFDSFFLWKKNFMEPIVWTINLFAGSVHYTSKLIPTWCIKRVNCIYIQYEKNVKYAPSFQRCLQFFQDNLMWLLKEFMLGLLPRFFQRFLKFFQRFHHKFLLGFLQESLLLIRSLFAGWHYFRNVFRFFPWILLRIPSDISPWFFQGIPPVMHPEFFWHTSRDFW